MSTQNTQKNEGKKSGKDPVSARIWRLHEESGLTNSQMIELSGLSNGWWHSRLRATRPPSDTSIRKLADRLAVDEDWIRTGSPEPDWEMYKLYTEQMTTRYKNVVREVSRQYGPQPKVAAIMSPDGAPVVPRANLSGVIHQLSQLLGIGEDIIRKTITDMINKEGRGA